MSTLNLKPDHYFQSDQVHLQAAGSDGSDSSMGIHLRWLFRGDLGDNHLPKGDYSTRQGTYNKKDDFVKIHRLNYSDTIMKNEYLVFKDKPYRFIGNKWFWIYKSSSGKVYYLRFLNNVIYDDIDSRINVSSSHFEFLEEYTKLGGVLELESKSGLFFTVFIKTTKATQGFELKAESFSEQEKGFTVISNRQRTSNAHFNMLGENMYKIRFGCAFGFVSELVFQFYDDFIINGISKQAWQFIGKFALTTDDNVANNRLEDPSNYIIDNHWHKFNDGAKVNVASYKARWYGNATTQIGIKEGVSKFLTLSANGINPKATEIISEPDGGLVEVSYLDILNVISTDFHEARVLGLGYIDSIDPDIANHIYIMEYDIPDKENAALTQHLYMSLPTRVSDQRKPSNIDTLPTEYGFDSQNTSSVTDNQGYTTDGSCRFMRVYVKESIDYSESQSFFVPSTEFSLAEFTPPIFVGIEYKKQGEVAWRDPEIAHQEIFGHIENLPLIYFEKGDRPSLVFQEKEEGIHEFASYPINIFSRAGQLSNTIATDYTKFTIANRLLPPSNFRVQLIQQESPLFLTSQDEQQLLQSLPNSDKLLLRVTFEINHLHDINHQFVEEVEFWFREQTQRIVKGQAQPNSSNALQVATSEYTGMVGAVPDIPIGLEANFIGSRMTLNGHQFEVDQILQSGLDPEILVSPNLIKETIVDDNGDIIMVDSIIEPSTDPESYFTLDENLKNPISWGSNILGFKLEVYKNTPIKTESFTNNDGKSVTRQLRGFWEDATVTQRIETYQNNGQSITQVFYDLVFDSFQLPPHHQNSSNSSGILSLSWYGGKVRLPIESKPQAEWKALKIVEINNGSGSLMITTIDEYYDVNNKVLTSANPGDSFEINLYPGYKIYFTSDASANFAISNILPTGSQFEKQTIFSALSRCANPNSGGTGYYKSELANAQTISAERVIAPLPPELPLGPLYATLPNKYSKSTYTFTVKLAQQYPYALVFYRTNLRSVLQALYQIATIENIDNDLPHPYEDINFNSRWNELVNMSLNSTNEFNDYPHDNGSFQFPLPDKDEFLGLSTTALVSKANKAIENSAVPILEEPLIFSKITEFKISPDHPAIKIPSDEVRFTDFNLNGDKVNAYFYFARELGSKYDLSDSSPILGPVQLINTRPPLAPQLKKIVTQVNDPIIGQLPQVRITILGFHAYARIRRLKLYRFLSRTDAQSIRLQQPIIEIGLNKTMAEGEFIELIDDFNDLTEIPYGDELFYRVVSCRQVKYIKDGATSETEIYVPSVPSKMLSTTIANKENPDTPILIASNDTINSNNEIAALTLTWNKTTYKGKYYLFKMNSVGNWNRIYTIETNDPVDLEFTLANPISKVNEDGNSIYHRFYVCAESASGLLSLEKIILTI